MDAITEALEKNNTTAGRLAAILEIAGRQAREIEELRTKYDICTTRMAASMEIEERQAAEIARLRGLLESLLPYLQTESEMLDYASLNEGRASEIGVLSMKVRRELRKP